MSDIKKSIISDLQRLNTKLYNMRQFPQRKPSTPNFSSLSLDSDDNLLDFTGKEVDDLDEICMVLFWLKKLFPKEPEMVNRVILEIQRYFKQEGQAKICLDQDFPPPKKYCEELESLRLYIKNTEKIPKPLGNPKVMNLFDEYHIMKKAGIGLPQEDIFNISMSIHYLLGMSPHISKIRFWGKINGVFRDYYILECDLEESEINIRKEKKQEALEKARSIAADQDKRPKITYLNTDSKSDILLSLTQKTEKHDEKNVTGVCDQTLEKENSLAEALMGEGDIPETKPYPTHELDFKILELKKLPSKLDSFKIPERPGIEVAEDWIVPEDDVGFGTNKKLFLVSNNTYNNWCELPTVTPHQIVVARQITRYFSGILEEVIDTCPAFPGTEGNYLRAQIARISAATQISPLGYYHFNLEEEEGEPDGEGGGDKHVGCTLNEDYFPMLMSELGAKTALDFWAHHTEYILKQGRTVFWTPFAAQTGTEGEGTSGPPQDVPKGPDLLTPISNDALMNDIPCWTLDCKSKLFPDSATAVARSNVWPGAYAYAFGTIAGTIYLGWGHKLNPFGHSFAQPPFPQLEYEVGPDVMESTDPTVEETLAWIEAHTPPPPPPHDMLGEGEGEQSPGEEEEDADEDDDD